MAAINANFDQEKYYTVYCSNSYSSCSCCQGNVEILQFVRTNAVRLQLTVVGVPCSHRRCNFSTILSTTWNNVGELVSNISGRLRLGVCEGNFFQIIQFFWIPCFFFFVLACTFPTSAGLERIITTQSRAYLSFTWLVDAAYLYLFVLKLQIDSTSLV